jgi:hypothetical protein
MCDACMEMDLYFAYLSEVEAKKQLAQQVALPWQCEVTVFPQAAEATSAPAAAPAKGNARFVCDEPE